MSTLNPRTHLSNTPAPQLLSYTQPGEKTFMSVPEFSLIPTVLLFRQSPHFRIDGLANYESLNNCQLILFHFIFCILWRWSHLEMEGTWTCLGGHFFFICRMEHWMRSSLRYCQDPYLLWFTYGDRAHLLKPSLASMVESLASQNLSSALLCTLRDSFYGWSLFYDLFLPWGLGAPSLHSTPG